MNVLPCEVRDGGAFFRGVPVATETQAKSPEGAPRLELGVRPEFVALGDASDDSGVPVEIVRISDAGRRRIVEARAGDDRINLLLDEEANVAPGPAKLSFDPAKTRVYADGWLVEGAA